MQSWLLKCLIKPKPSHVTYFLKIIDDKKINKKFLRLYKILLYGKLILFVVLLLTMSRHIE